MDETTSYAVAVKLVHKVLEEFRDEAFELARDMGIEEITAPGNLCAFMEKLRSVVFPRAAEEARELFRAAARNTGSAIRSRRRRWWKSGLSRQEALRKRQQEL